MTDYPTSEPPRANVSGTVNYDFEIHAEVDAQAQRAAIDRADEVWDDASRQVDHLVDLIREHRIDCPNPTWCISEQVQRHIEALELKHTQLLLHRALTNLAMIDE